MAEETKVIEKQEENITTPPADTSTATNDEAEARLAQIQIEKENYRIAYLKEKDKNRQKPVEGSDEETEDEKIERIVSEKMAASQMAKLDEEEKVLLQKVLKENKELKLAHLNKTNIPPAAVGTHTESTAVTDTTVTPEQLAYFKSKGYTDKDIERYKANLKRNMGR